MLRAGEIAQASSPKSKVINLLQVPGGSESQQVMLQVRFAEVNRRALQELGRQPLRARAATSPAVDDAAVRRAGLRRRRSQAGWCSATS